MTKNFKIAGMGCAIALCGMSAKSANAAVPATYSIVHTVHTDANDLNSPVKWTVQIDLHSGSAYDNWVAWLVDGVTITQFDGEGNPIATWVDESPTYTDRSSNWWVNHKDPENPSLSEFADEPVFGGTAIGLDPETSSIVYSWLGQPASPSNTSNATFSFVDFSTSEPIDGGEDEPVDSGTTGDPS